MQRATLARSPSALQRNDLVCFLRSLASGDPTRVPAAQAASDLLLGGGALK